MPAFLALQRFYRARTTDYQLRVEYLVLALLNALATGYFLCRVYGEPLKRCAANQSRPASRATTPVENGAEDTPTTELRGRRPLGGLPADRVQLNAACRTGTVHAKPCRCDDRCGIL